MKLGTAKEAELFKLHAYKSSWDVGVQFNFDKVYPNRRAVQNAVYSIYSKVKNNPKEYGVSQETVDLVAESMKNRAITKHQPETSLAEKNEEATDFRSIVLSNRDTAASILNKKLKKLDKSPKKIDNISFKDLTTAFGIMFDKGQILKGEATEHIAHYSKIEKDLSPDEAMSFIQKMREANMVKNAEK